MKNRIIALLLLCVMTVCTACNNSNNTNSTNSNNNNVQSSTKELFAMDTYMTVTAYGDTAEEAVDASMQEIQRLDSLWSVGNENSEVSLLNKNGTLQVSDETAYLIRMATNLYQSTDGALDITIYPLMVEWGFTSGNYKVPDDNTIKNLLSKVNAGTITISDDNIVTLAEGYQIDLGSVAKGYTSARIMDIFSKYDVISGMVSLGGNVQTYKTKVDGSKWKIAIQNPDSSIPALANADYVGVVEIEDKAVITSGGYERNFEENGKIYHHILDPKTGYPAYNGLISVSIISDDGCLADGLSTSLFVMGKNDALEYWKNHSDEFDTILVADDGTVTVTEGLQDCFSSDLDFEVVTK